jgi:hypothetical protein
MNEFLIQRATLEATADKIRDKLGLGKLSFKEEIGTNKVINLGTVTVYYIEYVDYGGDGYDGVLPNDHADDVFIAYDFIEDNNGVITPVIYKTDITGDEPDTPDYADQHFYVGQAEIDGVFYDKWRKIEPDSEYLDWDSTNKKYIYTNVIIDNNEYSPTDFPDKIEEVYNAGYETGCRTASDSVVGTWLFNEVPSFEGVVYGVPYPVKFTALGLDETLDSIIFENNKYGTSGDFLSYNYTLEDGSGNSGGSYTAYASVPVVWLKGGWDNDDYRTITIQEEFEDGWFKTWLKATAVKQVNPSDAPVLPTLTNPGTGADLAQGKQLIDSEGNIVEGTLPAPLVLQAQSTPTRVDSDGDYYFRPQAYYEFFDYEIVTDSDSCDFIIFNKTDRYLRVLCYACCIDADDSSNYADLYSSGTIAPNSTNTVELSTSDMNYAPRNPSWDERFIEGVRFI